MRRNLVGRVFGGHHAHHIATDNVFASHAAQEPHDLIHLKALHPGLNIGHTRRDRRIHAVKIKSDVDRRIAQTLVDDGHGFFWAHLAVALHGDELVAKLLAGVKPA